MARNKKNYDSEEGGGDELMASFADMMTLLLGFFMILYSMSYEDEAKFYEFGKAISSGFSKSEESADETSVLDASDYKREARAFQMLAAVLNLGDKNNAVTTAESLYKEKLIAESTKQEVQKSAQVVANMQGKIKETLDKKSNIILDITIPSEKLFASGSSQLANEATEQFKKLAELLSKIQTSTRFNIIGHTDSLPMNVKNKDNWSLSTDRALAVARELIKHGIDEGKISISGKAGTDPLYPEYDQKRNLMRENMAKNRRIQIQVETKTL